MQDITVVIVSREHESPYQTLRSLSYQSISFDVVITYDEGRGANYARNRGASLVSSPYILFSDNDIEWEPDAIESLYEKLKNFPEIAYSYGWYEMDGKRYCDRSFDAKLLRKCNYISTMSLIRTKDFLGFDESIERLQDWDLWLNFLERDKQGIFCEQKIFSTQKRLGITFGNGIDWEKAREIVTRKHGLP